MITASAKQNGRVIGKGWREKIVRVDVTSERTQGNASGLLGAGDGLMGAWDSHAAYDAWMVGNVWWAVAVAAAAWNSGEPWTLLPFATIALS